MENTIYISFFKTHVGELILGSYNDKLCLADWRYRKMRTAIDTRLQKYFKASYVENSTSVIEKTKQELTAYFKKELKQFSIPLTFAGTDFQQTVWQALQQIPYGKTESYLGLSRILGNEKAIRAVASANGANAISILVPCHRIIGKNGKLVGYAGGLPAKKKLLTLENALKTTQLELF
ncbi:MAG: methylated-DNA--[protein]-cysteine S-methyltransferase [Flavobacteriaceae bacterium]